MMGSGYTTYKRRCIGRELIFIWLPKRCYLTDKLLWLTHAYKETSMWVSVDTFFEYRYYDKKQYIFAKIKGIV
jgi:hypothetical protein